MNDDEDDPKGKIVTAFSDTGKRTPSRSKAEKVDSESTSSFIETSEKGRYAFISAIGFGIIAIIFIFLMPRHFLVFGFAVIGMGLLGAKGFALAYPKIVIITSTSTTVKSYFLTGILIMVWLIFIALAFQYLHNDSELRDVYATAGIEIICQSILMDIAVFFLAMTQARR